MDKLRVIEDRLNANDSWIGKIKPITKENLKNNTGNIEFLPKDTLRKRVEVPDGPIIGFGKYKMKTHEWVKENDKNYWIWLTENVDKFKNL